MVIGSEVTKVVELEEEWEDTAPDADDGNSVDPETDAVAVAVVRSLSIMDEIANTPAANVTDVAVKIGVAVRELRRRLGDQMLALLLQSAEQDCLRIAQKECQDG